MRRLFSKKIWRSTEKKQIPIRVIDSCVRSSISDISMKYDALDNVSEFVVM